MGCDIHCFVEGRHSGGPWQSLDNWEQSPHGSWRVPYGHRVYQDRSYPLFARLADVRNYPGTGVGAIDEPRGLPDGLSPEVARAYEQDEGDAHSMSWLTLQELWDAVPSDPCLVGDYLPYATDELRYLVRRLKEFDYRDGHDLEVRLVFWFDN